MIRAVILVEDSLYGRLKALLPYFNSQHNSVKYPDFHRRGHALNHTLGNATLSISVSKLLFCI